MATMVIKQFTTLMVKSAQLAVVPSRPACWNTFTE